MRRGEAGDRGCLEAAETAAMFPELGRALGLLAPLPGTAACPLPPLLLFPGEGSCALEAVLDVEAGSSEDAGQPEPQQQQRALIVVDGTWNQARQLLKRHGPALGLATRVMMLDCGPSRMAKIRLRQPGAVTSQAICRCL
jgi:hypothetical protein